MSTKELSISSIKIKVGEYNITSPLNNQVIARIVSNSKKDWDAFDVLGNNLGKFTSKLECMTYIDKNQKQIVEKIKEYRRVNPKVTEFLTFFYNDAFQGLIFERVSAKSLAEAKEIIVANYSWTGKPIKKFNAFPIDDNEDEAEQSNKIFIEEVKNAFEKKHVGFVVEKSKDGEIEFSFLGSSIPFDFMAGFKKMDNTRVFTKGFLANDELGIEIEVASDFSFDSGKIIKELIALETTKLATGGSVIEEVEIEEEIPAETLECYAEGGNIYSQQRSKEIAQEIINQLGGMNKLVAITGASNFMYGDGYLSFKPKSKVANYVKIELNPKDLYNVTFGKIYGMKYKEISYFEDVYADMLIPLFEKETKMYLRFEEGGNIDSKESLLAPNGKPSNLTPKQYELVRTPEFKAWFGDWENDPANASKVVDENGEPLVCYHGTNSDFWIFDDKLNKRGIFLSSKKEQAKLYGDKLISCFLNCRNIDIIKQVSKKWWKDKYQIVEKAIDSMLFKHRHDCVLLKDTFDPPFFEEDMPKIYSDIYILKNSNQIKLADGTNTTFDASNLDIRFAEGGNVAEKESSKMQYIRHAEIKFIFFKKDGVNWKVAGNDVLNGINMFAKGGSIEDDHFYVPKSDVSKVIIFEDNSEKEITDFINGYWVKKSAINLLEVDNPNKNSVKNKILLAPNGKPSNLTPKQYELVRTPEFKAWFGDWELDPANASKVIDENGEPLVVYHGTNFEFNVFDKKKSTDAKGKKLNLGFGKSVFYFTNVFSIAKKYGEKVKSFFINSKNPHIIKYFNGKKHSDNYTDYINAMNGYKVGEVWYGEIKNEKNNRAEIFVKEVKKEKQDSIIYGDEIVVFEPNQIKLADGTNTSFDASNPDIRFEEGGNLPKSNQPISVVDLSDYYKTSTGKLKADGIKLVIHLIHRKNGFIDFFANNPSYIEYRKAIKAIDIDNYHIGTQATFKDITGNLKEYQDLEDKWSVIKKKGEHIKSPSSDSEYVVCKNGDIYRYSDHWGKRIGSCDWYLDTKDKDYESGWKIGVCNVKDFTVLDEFRYPSYVVPNPIYLKEFPKRRFKIINEFKKFIETEKHSFTPVTLEEAEKQLQVLINNEDLYGLKYEEAKKDLSSYKKYFKNK